MTLEDIQEQVTNCEKCKLHETVKQPVFGEGPEGANAMIVGEAPGAKEDQQGKPFVGRSGNKLIEVLASVDIARDHVFITNIVKGRPPDNRNPHQDEIDSCFPYLEAQIATINPKIIVTLGNVATQNILDTEAGITSIRGEIQEWRGIDVLPMYHPSYLLRKPSTKEGSPKWQTWQDVKKLRDIVEKF